MLYNSLFNPTATCASTGTLDFHNCRKNPEISARKDYFLSYVGLKAKERKIGALGF
jgi:hypothetical protein